MARGLIVGVVVAGVAVAAALAVYDRISSEHAAERRALVVRNAELTQQSLAPGSALACLEAEAGASVANACELGVFATPQSVSAAVAFMTERLKLIEAAHVLAPAERNLFAAERRAIERDRFGIAAHVFARSFGCTAETCAALAMLNDTGTLKADLASQPFDALVARYKGVWDKPADERVPMAAVPVAPSAEATPAAAPAAADALARAEPPPANAPHPLDKKWKLPSADSIPAVSIMTAEPKLPKGEAQPEPKQPEQKTAEQKTEAPAPLPPKRPQGQATHPTQAAQPAEAR
jgi:2-hydroxychromene-2-carboxylate isomerase